MSENLPINVENQEEHGSITYATEVISTIVGVATTEVEGVSSMAGTSTISDILGRGKNVSRGVRVEVGAEEVSVDISIIVDYGMPIQKVCQNVQDNVVKSIETMTGLHVIKVDVHVQGVSFEKENKELREGQEVARLTTERSEQVARDLQSEDDGTYDVDLDGVLPEEDPVEEAAQEHGEDQSPAEAGADEAEETTPEENQPDDEEKKKS